MHITIAQRLRPYSHTPGTRLLLPGTDCICQVWPTRLLCNGIGELRFALTAPIQQFTVCQDLERPSIAVWGQSPEGFFAYRLHALEDAGVALHVERVGPQGLSIGTTTLQRGQQLALGSGSKPIPFMNGERLSLGSHKAQEWTGVARRMDFQELFPVWYRLGQLSPQQPPAQGSGTTELLQRCREVIAEGKPEQTLARFEALFHAGFEGLLVPRLEDNDYQGYSLSAPVVGESAVSLLTEGAALIRSLLLQHRDHTLHLLPHLPPELHCGRLLNAACGANSTLDMEWSKKTVRRVVLRCGDAGQWTLQLPPDLRQFRLRQSPRDPGRFVSRGDVLHLKAGTTYWLDRFER